MRQTEGPDMPARPRCRMCGRYRDDMDDDEDDRCASCRQAQTQTTILMELPSSKVPYSG